jgi:hypothetical protein
MAANAIGVKAIICGSNDAAQRFLEGLFFDDMGDESGPPRAHENAVECR